jgi:two-component system, OmpR family, response regulator
MAHILLVDDDQDLIEINQTILVQRGHQVTAAYSAAEAWKLFQENPPELAVLDVMMEDKTSGFGLARRMHERMPQLPMIMLTGIRKALKLGYSIEPDETWLPVSKVMEKPVNPRVLADEVEKLLAARA